MRAVFGNNIDVMIEVMIKKPYEVRFPIPPKLLKMENLENYT
jgi:hypothetical protein